MKTLDLTKLGVQEMNSYDLKAKEGGTTCPTMGSYYQTAGSGIYAWSVVRGFFRGFNIFT